MYKTLGIAAAFMLVSIAAPATAAPPRQEPGIAKQAVGEEFGSQRRRVHRRTQARGYLPPWSIYVGYSYTQVGFGYYAYPYGYSGYRGFR
jgi:hypothetical protein